jgi:hypothetical protein
MRYTCNLLAIPLLGLLGLVGCSGDVCGPGTQRRELDNGDTACVAVDVAKGDTICDADAGVVLIEGNRCVSAVQCGEGTALDPASGQCLPTGLAPHTPAPCAAPAAGRICVNGTLRNFLDGSFLSGATVHVAVYDPSTFIGTTPPALAETDASDTYRLPDMPAPGSGFLLVVTSDPAGAGAAVYEATGIGGIAQSGKSVRVDAYVLTRAQLGMWSSTAGAVDFDGGGALVYRFFNDPAPPQDARTPTETHPVMGVQLIDTSNSMPATGALYFGASLAAIDRTLTATSAVGGVVVPGGAAGGIRVYTGRGGNVTTWEAHQSFAIPHIVQIDFLHPMM